jgi:hypothetical protein
MVDLSIVMLVYRRVKLHFPMVFLWFSIKTSIFLWCSYGFPIKTSMEIHSYINVYRRVIYLAGPGVQTCHPTNLQPPCAATSRRTGPGAMRCATRRRSGRAGLSYPRRFRNAMVRISYIHIYNIYYIYIYMIYYYYGKKIIYT